MIVTLFISKIVKVFNEFYALSVHVPTIKIECFTILLTNIKMNPYYLFTNFYIFIMFTKYPSMYHFSKNLCRYSCLNLNVKKGRSHEAYLARRIKIEKYSIFNTWSPADVESMAGYVNVWYETKGHILVMQWYRVVTLSTCV